jgi:hypothetical protein
LQAVLHWFSLGARNLSVPETDMLKKVGRRLKLKNKFLADKQAKLVYSNESEIRQLASVQIIIHITTFKETSCLQNKDSLIRPSLL